MVAVEQGHHRELSHYHLPSDRSSRLVLSWPPHHETTVASEEDIIAVQLC